MSSIPKVDGLFVNTDGSHGSSYTFTDTTVSHTRPPCLNYLSGGKNKKKHYNMKSKKRMKNEDFAFFCYLIVCIVFGSRRHDTRRFTTSRHYYTRRTQHTSRRHDSRV